jgi:hypothetical protein
VFDLAPRDVELGAPAVCRKARLGNPDGNECKREPRTSRPSGRAKHEPRSRARTGKHARQRGEATGVGETDRT